MKTAEEVIEILQELPPEERRKVAEYLYESEEEFLEENYSPEDMAKIEHDLEEAKQGINVIGPFYTTEELLSHLDSIQPE
ncbi:MAG: hypothetical protein AB1656_13110 [Candidatus Omnitrophota bacterium]